MRKRFLSFWEDYKFRFVPWLIFNLKQKRVQRINADKSKIRSVKNPVGNNDTFPQQVSSKDVPLSGPVGGTGNEINHFSAKTSRDLQPNSKPSSVIVHHVELGDDKLIGDSALLQVLIKLCEHFSQLELICRNDRGQEVHRRNQEIMHNVLGYSIERRKSLVSDDAGTGVFIASGCAQPGALIALYPGALYLPSEPLFFPSIGNPFIFRCSDGIHIDGNDKWLSKSIFKSCAARDKFHVELPCCDMSWLTSTPINPLNIGQYVNNRSKVAVNNVVYQESHLTIAMSLSDPGLNEFPVRYCKYLPNVWANPGNNHHPLRLVPLVAVRPIEEGEEILSSYFTVVHPKEGTLNSQK